MIFNGFNNLFHKSNSAFCFISTTELSDFHHSQKLFRVEVRAAIGSDVDNVAGEV